MALIRWQPFSELNTLSHEMNHLFDQLIQANGDSPDVARQAITPWMPAIEIKQTDADVILRAELPGVTAEDLDVQVTRNAVSIAGEHRYEKRSEEKSYFRSELRYGKFQRIVPLPAKVQNDQVKADLKDGVLTLTLPKIEDERRKVFKVNLSGARPEVTSAENNHSQGAATVAGETA
jgi:HSP20 family protein